MKQRILAALLSVVLLTALLSAPVQASEHRGINTLTSSTPAEQLSLTPGETYWFDLSGAGIPGTVNTGNELGAASVPDATLRYVPFTYAGTVNAYVLKTAASGNTGASADAAESTDSSNPNGYAYDHSLFIADYNVTHTVSWDDLQSAEGKDFIFGTDYTSGGVNYLLRSLSVGSRTTGETMSENQRGNPENNEWDAILNKGQYIKNWRNIFLWGQDTGYKHTHRGLRGLNSSRYFAWSPSNIQSVERGFRPILEILNPAALTSDGLKTVTLNLDGGKVGTSDTKQEGPVKIVIRSGDSFTAPSQDGLTRPSGNTEDFFRWKDSGGNTYTPGATVPATVTELTAAWGMENGMVYIDTQPAGQSSVEGKTTGFSVTTTGGAATGYQWQVNEGTGWSNVTDGTGGTTASYTTPAITAMMNGWQYRCVVSGSQGTDTSSAAVLTVSATPPSGGSISNLPSVSVKDGGGTVSAGDGTVTITPEDGYIIGEVTVNGEKVEVPENGKLPGLSSSDKVVVTFVKISEALERFTDLDPRAWYYGSVAFVMKNGLFYGTSGTTFSPNGRMDRAMLAAVLYRAAGEPDMEGEILGSPFEDVGVNAYYGVAVYWARQNGITSGTSEEKFSPYVSITREQLAAMLYRYAEYKGLDVSGRNDLSGYTDADSISAYAREPMEWANAAGLILGRTATELAPKGTATRAETAAMLHRFLKLN